MSVGVSCLSLSLSPSTTVLRTRTHTHARSVSPSTNYRIASTKRTTAETDGVHEHSVEAMQPRVAPPSASKTLARWPMTPTSATPSPSTAPSKPLKVATNTLLSGSVIPTRVDSPLAPSAWLALAHRQLGCTYWTAPPKTLSLIFVGNLHLGPALQATVNASRPLSRLKQNLHKAIHSAGASSVTFSSEAMTQTAKK